MDPFRGDSYFKRSAGTDTPTPRPHPAFMIGQPSIHCPAKTPALENHEKNHTWIDTPKTSKCLSLHLKPTTYSNMFYKCVHIMKFIYASPVLHEVLTASTSHLWSSNLKVPTESLCEFVEHHRHSLGKVLPRGEPFRKRVGCWDV